MPFAKAKLQYLLNGKDEERNYSCAYFLNSKDVILKFTELGIWNSQLNYIQVIIQNLNFELGVRDTKLHIEIGDKRYKIDHIEPVAGYGLSATMFYGNQIK